MPTGDEYLQLIQARYVNPERPSLGSAPVREKLTSEGEQQLSSTPPVGELPAEGEAKYSGGPVFTADASRGALPFEVWATYESEVPGERGSRGQMTGTPAVIAAEYGQGRIVGFRCHCERGPGPQGWFYRAIRWSARCEAPASEE